MTKTRRRRIVRRVALTLSALVLLPAWYVGTWLGVSRAEYDGFIGFAAANRIQPAFSPLVDYCQSDLPGAEVLCRTWWFVTPPKIIDFKDPLFGHPGLAIRFGASSFLMPQIPDDIDAEIRAEYKAATAALVGGGQF